MKRNINGGVEKKKEKDWVNREIVTKNKTEANKKYGRIWI